MALEGKATELDLEEFGDGRDEMNLVEFPLSAVAERFLDGRKTVVFSERVWDREQRRFVKRELAISGSDRYGLPTAKDEDVLLACLQLTRLIDFQSREVQFTRYELLKLLRWADEGKSYQRLATSLRRWKGVTLFSDRAFYDHAFKSWVNRDFGVFDNLHLYERELGTAKSGIPRSRFTWNEVLFRSFEAGYIKRLDWNLYCQLEHPVAKRLYRLLDKRFYRDNEVVFDLHELAFRRIRMSSTYHTGEIKRLLTKGLDELTAAWDLGQARLQYRYVKQQRGNWQVVFKRSTSRRQVRESAKIQAAQDDLAVELTKRDVGPAMAAELAGSADGTTIREMIELYDWYGKRGEQRGPGFLVESIRNPSNYRKPPGFVSSADRSKRKADSARRDSTLRRKRELVEASRLAEENARQEAFIDFWSGLDEVGRAEFEIRALTAAEPLKRDGYRRLQQAGGAAFEQYRQVILRDLFEVEEAKAGEG